MAVAFVVALFWAKARDPFKRIEFSLRTAQAGKAKGRVVLPKDAKSLPVVVFLHGSGGNLMQSGNDLRQLAEQNLAAIGLEYDQTNQVSFDEQFIALQRYLSRQTWAKSDAVAWVGFSLGAQRSLSFLLTHPEIQPQLYVRVAGGMVEGLDKSAAHNPEFAAALPHVTCHLSRVTCKVLLVHGADDEVFPVADCRKLADSLRETGIPVDIHIFPGQPHAFGSDRLVVMRGIGEYCARFFGSPQPLQINRRSLYLHYWLPVGVLFTLCIIGGYSRWRASVKVARISKDKWSKPLTCLAWVLAMAALAETGLNLGLPRLEVSESRPNLARRWLVRPHLRNDFDWLASQRLAGSALGTDAPRIVHGVRGTNHRNYAVGDLLEHLELADLQRKFFYSDLDETTYRNFILSPVITNSALEDLNWRRALWENFYPRIRRENDPVMAAKIVVRFLRERVSISPDHSYEAGVETIWAQGMANEAGFERIYVAALRSVGIAARLNDRKQTELLADGKWHPAPRPLITNIQCCPRESQAPLLIPKGARLTEPEARLSLVRRIFSRGTL